MQDDDVIAAIATAPGQGALAVIRMSGGEVLRVLEACTPDGFAAKIQPRRVVLSKILSGESQTLDEVLVTYFVAPASFTGENVVEIACHGGVFVTQKLLERLVSCGARPAEPGEFTKRAFLNGRLDLTQAEAVMDIISAGSQLALKAAQDQLQGSMTGKVAEQVRLLSEVLAHIEAYIDFPDEDIAPDTISALRSKLQMCEDNVIELLDTVEQGRMIREGIKTVIIGAPNVGKSSLLNMLLGYERAIVSDVAGTTRDTVEELIRVGGLLLRLIDTAGLHESGDVVEQAGMDRTLQALQRADLVIEVVDASQPRMRSLLPADLEAQRILVLNKSDLGIHQSFSDGHNGIPFSCVQGQGKAELEAKLVQLFTDHLAHSTGHQDIIAINARHQHVLQAVLPLINTADSLLEANASPELVSLELREALTHLGEITGKVDTEDILDIIFSSFCIGK